MNIRKVFYLVSISLWLIVAGCACSPKTPESPQSAAEHEQSDGVTAENSLGGELPILEQTVENRVDGGDMDWKYQNEILVKCDTADGFRKVEDMYEKGGGERVPIHLQYEIKTGDDLNELSSLSATYGKMVTTFEVLIQEGVLGNRIYRVRLSGEKDSDTRFIVTGVGEQPVDLPGIEFDIMAGTVLIRNLKFNRQEYRSAIQADVLDKFVAESLVFEDNQYDRNLMGHLAKPLIVLKSHAAEGGFSSCRLKDVSFVGNKSFGLVSIAKESLGKFDFIELEHVVAKDNSNQIGIDVSAAKEAVIKNSELTGSTSAPTIVQTLPQTQVKFVDSVVSDRVYGYRPHKENWNVEPKAVIKENVTEAEGTVFERVP